MGVYIDGMEMPKKGHLIIRIYASGEVCEPTECAGVWGKVATAVPVPPHGDLIERDKLREKEFIHDGDAYAVVMSRDIRNAPTIIPAEEGEK